MDIKVETVGPKRVAYLRAIGPYPQTFPGLWKRFAATVGPLGLFGRGATLSVMHDDPRTTPPERLRGDAAIEVSPDFVPAGELAVQDLPGGPFAVHELHGPYTGLPKAWGELVGQWLPGSGHARREAASFEVYVNDPTSVAPERLLTRLYLPIEPR